MNLESMPNEILLDLFDYLDDIDVFRGFYGLNSRFDYLIHDQGRAYRLKFRSISRRTFDMICQQHLPFIADRVLALCLSDGKEAPEQINRFCYYLPSFSSLIQLRSLTIVNVRSRDTMFQIVQKSHKLDHLTHLKFSSRYTVVGWIALEMITNNIWNLPKLTHFDLDMRANLHLDIFCTPTIISTSLQSISISQYTFKWPELNQLFQHTPHLTCLNASIHYFGHPYISSYFRPTLLVLNINFSFGIRHSQLASFFQNTPHLRRLNIILHYTLIDGQQWEHMIQKYLTQLRIFRLQMQDSSYYFGSSHSKVNVRELVNSFRTSFWIDERQWFVRCLAYHNKISLHTLSSTFQYCNVEIPVLCISTSPYNDQQQLYDNMTGIYDENFFEQFIPSDIHLSNLQYLCIELPIPTQFSSVVSSLKRLDFISILYHSDEYQSQLQALLDRATQLRSLHIHQRSSLPLQTSLFTYTNASVRRLAIQNCGHYLTKEECRQLRRSPLGAQCDVLSVMVQKRENIVYLIRELINLRMLILRCADDKYSQLTNEQENSQNKNELVDWLEGHLPSTCSIVRDRDKVGRIRICL